MILKAPTRVNYSGKPYSVKTILGTTIITEQILIDLIESQAMQRLKGIHQYGISYYAQKPHNYTRYEHSLGVMHLLQEVDAPLSEKVAGLLHDVSHTVFSHVADTLFDHQSELNSYQDDIHRWYIEQTDIPKILQKHGFTIDQILHKGNNFSALEQDVPDLCADRIEYLLNGGFHEAIIPHYQVKKMWDALIFEEGRWYFSDEERARDLALCSLYLTEHHFGAPWNIVTYQLAADMLKHAMCIGLVTHEEVHFSQDEKILKRLKCQGDSFIKHTLQRIKEFPIDYEPQDETDFDMHVRPKFRGVDPWVKTEDGLKRLSEINTLFKEEFDRVKTLMHKGWYLKFR